MGFAIRSVLAQTEPDFELFVVGDGCTDGTASVVESFADDRIRWYDLPKAPNFGYANRNVALREARGDLIAFMAHDDLLLSDHLRLMGQAFDQPDVEWAYSRPLWMDDAGVAVPFAMDLRRPDAFRTFMEVGNSIPAACVVHRRSCLDRYGYWPEEVVQAGDWVLWRRIIGPSAGANLEYVPTITSIHFRASWRTGAVWGPSPLQEWLADAAISWWPEDLKLDVRPGLSPQAEMWERLAADPSGWSRRLRGGVIDVIDGIAWASPELRRDRQRERERADALQGQMSELQVQVGELRGQVDELQHQVNDQAVEMDRRAIESRSLRRELASARTTTEVLLGSTSWRVTAPLRLLGDSLRRIRGNRS